MLIFYRLSATTPLAKLVSLGPTDTLKLLLTTVDGKTAKRPHQAFLTLTEPTTGLEESFALNVKDNGKAKLDLVWASEHYVRWLFELTYGIFRRRQTYPTNS